MPVWRGAGDWMRRGLLAERLFHDGEALLAFRCSNLLAGFNMTASMGIMRLAAQTGDARQVNMLQPITFSG